MVTAQNSRRAADGGEAGQTRLPRRRRPEKRRQRERRPAGGEEPDVLARRERFNLV